MKRKMKKKREGVAAKPRRQGNGEGGGRKKKKKRKKKRRKKRNAGFSPATPAALQAAPARETTFRVWSAVGRRQQDEGSEWRGESPGGGWKGRLKMEKWKKSGSREDVGNKKKEEKGWDDGVGGGGWRYVRRRPAKPEGRRLAVGGLCGLV